MSEENYAGKPLAYFDQNILDLFVKKIHHGHDIYILLKENYQIVYSDTTLGEIYKAYYNSKDPKDYQKYIDILDNLDAYHMRIACNYKFEFLDKCVISTVPVSEWFKRYVENKKEWQFLDSYIFNQILLNYQKDKNIEKVENEALKAFQDNLNIIEKANKELQSFPELAEQSQAMLQEIYNQKNTYEKNLKFMLSKIIEHAENEKMTEIFRKEMSIFPKQLNNIEKPNVVEKIWSLYREKDDYKNFDIEDFWSISFCEKAKGRKLYNYEKVNILYNMMNFIGFNQDTELDNKNGIQRAMCDFSHAQIASFCNFFFTNDKKLKKKTEAIYEYLDIPTKLININIERKED